MALVTNLTHLVEIPHEPGQTLTVRRLSWRELEEAKAARGRKAIASFKDLGPELMEQLRRADRPEPEQSNGASQRSAEDYDRGVLLRAGIVEWSYDAPVNEETVEQLDEETAAFAAEAILGLHERTEADRKNG